MARSASSAQSANGVRVFEEPKIKFDATGYVYLIDWGAIVVTEPPILSHVMEEQLGNIVHKGPIDLIKLSFARSGRAIYNY